MFSPRLAELPEPPESYTIWPWTRASRPLPATTPDGHAWPRISIVIPSFNQAAFLEQALRSVLLQGYPNLEVIVMDGGSSDGTTDILHKYDPWLKHWESSPDRGPAAALNRGFTFAGGDLYAFLNADDFYLPNCLETIATRFADGPAADVISAHGYFARATGELGVRTFSDRWDLQRFKYGVCVLLQPATFFRRAAFERAGGFRATGSVCWDMELWAELARTGARFALLDAFTVAFRLHPRSITGRGDVARRRRTDARKVMAAMRGRSESRRDRILHVAHRILKFSRHPIRTLQQRVFFYSALNRWSL